MSDGGATTVPFHAPAIQRGCDARLLAPANSARRPTRVPLQYKTALASRSRSERNPFLRKLASPVASGGAGPCGVVAHSALPPQPLGVASRGEKHRRMRKRESLPLD